MTTLSTYVTVWHLKVLDKQIPKRQSPGEDSCVEIGTDY